MTPRGFQFPPLGPANYGEVQHRGKHGDLYWKSETDPQFYVTLQSDKPAVAFRCYYPGGSTPCNQRTALEYISYVKGRFSEE